MNAPTHQRCSRCHHARQDGPRPHFKWWCALQRLRAPDGSLTVAMAWPAAYAFELGREPQFTATRAQSPGPAEGWSADWRTGQKHPQQWRPCPEFLATTP